jgi:hypothetical protein
MNVFVFAEDAINPDAGRQRARQPPAVQEALQVVEEDEPRRLSQGARDRLPDFLVIVGERLTLRLDAERQHADRLDQQRAPGARTRLHQHEQGRRMASSDPARSSGDGALGPVNGRRGRSLSCARVTSQSR